MVLVRLVGSRADGSRILEMSSVQKGGFIQARGQDPGAERAAACGSRLPGDEPFYTLGWDK